MLPRLVALLLLRQVPGTFAYLAPAQQRVIGPLQQQLSMQKSLRSFFAAESSPKRQRKGTEEEPDAEEKASEVATTTAASSSPLSETKVAEEPVELPDFTWEPFNTIEPGWRARLAREYSLPYFQSLREFVDQERRTHTIYPPADQMFTALNLCSYDNVKVVVVGQDPYHGPNQAHGMAFSVQMGQPQPPSLKNMIKEAMADVGIAKPTHGNLSHWASQGVLLLNVVLTVRARTAYSHKGKGWETFTDAIIREVNKKDHVVFLVWGQPAMAKVKGIDTTKHKIISCAHPSPLSATKTNKPFIGSRCFSKCNEALVKFGLTPIDWNL